MSTDAGLKFGSRVIAPEEQTPLVLELVEFIGGLQALVQSLRDEIHQLKGTTRRPKSEPSRLLNPPKPKPQQRRIIAPPCSPLPRTPSPRIAMPAFPREWTAF